MSFFDDVARNIGNFFGINKPKAPAPRPTSAPRQTIQAPTNTLRGAATASVSLPQFDNSAALAAQEEERKRREAEELARRQAEEKRRAEEARKAEVARMAAQAVRDTNQQLGQDYQTIGGEDLKAMQREATRGGDANLEAIKQYRQKIIQRKQQAATAQTGPAPVTGVPQAVAGTLEQKRQQVLALQKAVATGHAEDWQVRNATVDFYNEQKRAEKVKHASEIATANPKDFVGSFNKMSEGEQRKVIDSLTQVSKDYAMAGADPELAGLAKAAQEKLAILQADPNELKKHGLDEVKKKSSFGGTVEDIVKGVAQGAVDAADLVNLYGQGLLGINPTDKIDEMLKKGQITKEEHIRLTNEMNSRITNITGSATGQDKGVLDRAGRVIGDVATVGSYFIPVGAGANIAKATAGSILKTAGKDALIGTGVAGLSAINGEDTKWQEVLAASGFGAAGSVLGSTASGLLHLKQFTKMAPEDFAKLSPEVQRQVIKGAEESYKAAPVEQAPQPDGTAPFEPLANVPDVNTQLVDQPHITPNAVNGLAAGGRAAANAILDKSGYTYQGAVRDKISEELAHAKSPDEVSVILHKYGIVHETPQEALQRVNKAGEENQAAQAQKLAETPQDVAEPVATPAPETATPKLENSADIQQNYAAFDKTSTRVEELKAIPAKDRTAAQKAELRQLGKQLKEQKATTPVNPALTTNEKGEVVPIGKREAGDNLASFQTDLMKHGDEIPEHLHSNLRQLVNLSEKLKDASPELAKHLNTQRAFASEGMANVIRRGDADTKYLDKEVLHGLNKEQLRTFEKIANNFSKPGVAKKYKGTPEYEAAVKWRAYVKQILPELNDALYRNGQKTIGKIDDYFPAMYKLNRKKDSFTDMLASAPEGSAAPGEAKVTRGFMKSRDAITKGKTIDPHEAAMMYARQAAQVIHLTPVVERGKAMAKVAHAVADVHDNSEAMHHLAGLFEQQANQIAGHGVHPQTGIQKGVSKVRNVVSRSQIAGSINSVYAQIANPVAVINRQLADKGLLKGTYDTLHLAKNLIKTTGKRVEDLEHIDLGNGKTVSSNYLVTARGASSDGKKIRNKILDAGYRFSNFGDLQTKHAAVQTIYDSLVREGKPMGEATLHEAEDKSRFAIGDRTMGERSRLTASGNAGAQLLSQYQIEQLANVFNIIDGTLLNPKLSPWKKFVGTMAAAGTAYGANQVTGAITNGQVKPLPDLIGAGIDAYTKVQETDDERKKNGEKPLTPEEKAGLFTSNTASSYISNLPFGRTALSLVTAGVNEAGSNTAINNKHLANDLGLNAKDTNPMQTLPTAGAIISTASTVGKGLSGKESWLPDPQHGTVGVAGDVVAKVTPFGGQAKKTAEGAMTFANGGSRYADSKDKDGNVKKGDQQFKVNNDLKTFEGWQNLFAMATSGKYANKDAQRYLRSGFQTLTESQIKDGKIPVSKMTDAQYETYAKESKKRFAGTLSDKEKRINALMGNDVLLNRNLGNGKVKQEEIDALKVKKNQYMFKNGLIDQIDTGFKKEELDKLTPTLKAWVYDKAINGRKGYKEKATTDASRAVIDEALKNEEAWPGIDLSNVKATNELADKYLSYKMDSAKKPNDEAEQFDLRKKFWGQVVRQKYDKDIPGAYIGPEGTSTNARDTYGQNIGNIEKMMTDDGLKVGSKLYRLNGKDIKAMVALDDELVKAGLISKPKFSDKFRAKYGIHAAPTADDGYEGGYDGSKSSGGRGGRGGSGGSGPKSDANPTDYLLKTGTGSKGFDIKQAGGEAAAPAMNLAQYRNKGAKSGKSSIKIKL